MSQYIDLSPYDFIDRVLLVADIGGSDVDAAPLVEQDVDAYISAHPDFVNYVLPDGVSATFHNGLPDGDSVTLHMARLYRYYGTAKYLLERGANVNYVNPRTKESILTYALKDKYAPPEFIEYLRNHPAVVAMENARSAKGFLIQERKGVGKNPDVASKIGSFLTGEEGSTEQQAAKLKKKATGARRKTKKNKKQKRRKTRKSTR